MAFRIVRGNAGLTLVEVMVSLGIVFMVVFGTSAILETASRSTDRTQSRSELETNVALAAEKVNACLMEARSITIDSNGLGLTYKYPPKDIDGTYTSSASAVESTSRRLYESGGDLYCSDDPDHPILSDIPTNDPDTGSPLRIFTIGLNSREIQVRLVSRRTVTGYQTVCSSMTTRVRPRNVPQP